MPARSDIDVAAEAYGEDALGPLFTRPLVIETDIERADREEREYEARAYEEWADSYLASEREWWESEGRDAS